MTSLNRTIIRLEKIASDTEDFNTAISLQELNSDLRRRQKSTTYYIDIKSLLVGVVIGLIILAGITDANAGQVNIPFTSWHSQDREYYNDENYGLGYSFDATDTIQAQIGCYKNSFYRTSCYIGGNYHQSDCSICIGVFVGGVTGYDNVVNPKTPVYTRNLSPFQPVVLPNVTVKFTKVSSITVGYIPAFTKDAISFATVTYNHETDIIERLFR